MTRNEARRGSALIMALLVILVLTTVGIGLAYFTATEDRSSGNARLQKAGFYAAEAGLRAGEVALSDVVAGNVDPTSLLPSAAEVTATTPSSTTYDPPGGGNRAKLFTFNGSYKEKVASQSLDDPNARLIYTLWIRNNPEDVGGAAWQDVDKKVNLVSVGEYVTVDGTGAIVSRGIQKVLEEQVNLKPEGSAAATQKGGQAGGTGSGMKNN